VAVFIITVGGRPSCYSCRPA